MSKEKEIELKGAKPFLKWAGGKTQLIPEIERRLPDSFKDDSLVYVEPFVGSGALFFYVLNTYPNIKKAIINDVNVDLITTYRVIRDKVDLLISRLEVFQMEYHSFIEDDEARKHYYLEKRIAYNDREHQGVETAALFIFLNKTCFNGLYRVNGKGGFNVPIGSSKTPGILNESNLQEVSKVLQKVEILDGDYTKTLDKIKSSDENVFFYFDPPYRPLSNTSSFNAYAKSNFNDEEQIRLKEFCDKLDTLNYQWLLSNSDVKSVNPEDEFFDELFDKYSIERVLAKRFINANGNGRGKINELMINNYLD